MKKKETSKIRKSGFNADRACYLTADGKYYCYKFEDIENGQTVTQKLEVGKDLSLELTIMLDETDHDSDLKDRYENELRDPLFEAKVKCYEEGHITIATVVDHIVPHRGDQKLFWDRGNWQPLCEHHHNVKTMTEDRYVEYKF